MSIRINLLPHRQIKRAERQRQFGLMAAAVAIFGLAIIFMGYTYISNNLHTQNSRNQRLKDAIVKLDNDIKEIAGLKETINELKERIQAVESLQDNRSVAVAMLDEVARKLPEAVTLNSLKQTGDLITLQGNADTNARVADLIANLSQSGFLLTPQLVEVTTLRLDSSRKLSAFTITAKLKIAAPVTDEKQKGKAKPKGGKP
jgi:type IV pilus assembly protein PilN